MSDIKLITENLLDELIPSIQKANGIYILTSFVMGSGARLLAPHLKEAASRGAEIKLLAGDYLFVTQPDALRALLSIDRSIQARLWRSKGTSFHPKAYLFDYSDGEGLFIVGSSNLSLSAFRMGVEWNLAVNARLEPITFQYVQSKFIEQFQHENTQPLHELTISIYEKEYEKYHEKNPELIRTITEVEEIVMTLPHKQEKIYVPKELARTNDDVVTPRYAQKIALEALNVTRDEGYNKAMVVMATGLGKTYLAGFFAQQFRRVLFVAHREEILNQAVRSFLNIMPHKTTGLYNGFEKDQEADFVFASIHTLSMKKHLERFEADALDLIVIDEFHHAAANSYQALLQYFKPEFLLGITATPDRMDGKDVYALCEGNVAYRIHFLEAISEGWLSPFHYYGVHDETDYSQITWLGNRYDEEELMSVQLKSEKAELIFKAWMKHRQTRTLAFCSSIAQADFLAEYFRERGITVVSLHSRTKEMTREAAIYGLSSGLLEMIFTVDLFNEGVDIPEVDTLLFARPTESLTVFTQQVGRGLRLHERKSACTIIDLIGNYRNADIKLRLFQVEQEKKPVKGIRDKIMPILPEGCLMDLEVSVINLLEELSRKSQPRREKLRDAYFHLKQDLGRRPSYVELHLYAKADSREYRQEFGSYVGFLQWAKELSESEEIVYQAYDWWLREAEQTVMSKSYKMVLLLAMLERGPSNWYLPFTSNQAAPFFQRYLTEREYRKKIDFSDSETSRLWVYDEDRVSRLVSRMPMSKWSGSSKGRISFENSIFMIELEIEEEHLLEVFNFTKEICEYRLHTYFERKAD